MKRSSAPLFALLTLAPVMSACASGADIDFDTSNDPGPSTDTDTGSADESTSSVVVVDDYSSSGTQGSESESESESGSEDSSTTSSPVPADGVCSPERTWRVFVLSGQGNMHGHGLISPTPDQIEQNGGLGTLEYVADNLSSFDYLKDDEGEWMVRDDVWVVGADNTGPLTVGFGWAEDRIGPELGFGQVVGEFFDDPVLIIKASWPDGRSLGVDFRPPSAGGQVGPQYIELVERVRYVLDNLATELPAYDGEPYRLEGIVWHQGWNDRINEALNAEYESNAVHFINDLREDLEIPELPFVLATTGMAGWSEDHPNALSLMEAQLAVPDNPGLLEPTGVGAVETRSFWQPAEESPADAGYLWNRNALTHLQIGAGLAEQMVEFAPDCEQ